MMIITITVTMTQWAIYTYNRTQQKIAPPCICPSIVDQYRRAQ